MPAPPPWVREGRPLEPLAKADQRVRGPDIRRPSVGKYRVPREKRIAGLSLCEKISNIAGLQFSDLVVTLLPSVAEAGDLRLLLASCLNESLPTHDVFSQESFKGFGA